MEAVLFAFALGAGTVVVAKRGRRVLRRALGWTAETTGFVTARVADALDEAHRLARDRYLAGRERRAPLVHADVAPSTRSNGADHPARVMDGGPSVHGSD